MPIRGPISVKLTMRTDEPARQGRRLRREFPPSAGFFLVRYFVQKLSRRMNRNIESIPTEIIGELERWHLPGNIREPETFIERAVILTPGSAFFAPIAERHAVSPDRTRAGTMLQDVEREYILLTLRGAGGVIAGARGAAARLGMRRTTLQSRMQKLGITREEQEV
jgi:formate hydrogenlyase transcriptional activator